LMADTNQDGVLTYEEFIPTMHAALVAARDANVANSQQAWEPVPVCPPSSGYVDSNAYVEEQLALPNAEFADKFANATNHFEADKERLMEQLRSAHREISLAREERDQAQDLAESVRTQVVSKMESLDTHRISLEGKALETDKEWQQERKCLLDDIREYKMRSEVAEARTNRNGKELEALQEQLDAEVRAHKKTQLELQKQLNSSAASEKELRAVRNSSQRMQELRDQFKGHHEEALLRIEKLEGELGVSNARVTSLTFEVTELQGLQQQLTAAREAAEAMKQEHDLAVQRLQISNEQAIAKLNAEVTAERSAVTKVTQERDSYQQALYDLRRRVFKDQEDQVAAENSLEAQLIASKVEANQLKQKNEELEQKFAELKLALWAMSEKNEAPHHGNQEHAETELLGLHRRLGRILDCKFPATSHLASPPSPPSPRSVPAMRRVHEPHRFNNKEMAH